VQAYVFSFARSDIILPPSGWRLDGRKK